MSDIIQLLGTWDYKHLIIVGLVVCVMFSGIDLRPVVKRLLQIPLTVATSTKDGRVLKGDVERLRGVMGTLKEGMDVLKDDVKDIKHTMTHMERGLDSRERDQKEQTLALTKHEKECAEAKGALAEAIKGMKVSLDRLYNKVMR